MGEALPFGLTITCPGGIITQATEGTFIVAEHCGHDTQFRCRAMWIRQGNSMKQITVFYLEECLLGMDSVYINVILPPAGMIKIPQKTEQLFQGMMKLSDGRLVHIINSGKLLGLSPSADRERKVLALQYEPLPLGLIVDGPTRLLEIDEKTIASHLPISKINSDFFAGTVMDENNNVVLLLNMPVLLSVLTSS